MGINKLCLAISDIWLEVFSRKRKRGGEQYYCIIFVFSSAWFSRSIRVLIKKVEDAVNDLDGSKHQ